MTERPEEAVMAGGETVQRGCREMVVEVRLCSEAVEAVMSELSILVLLLI